jgi:TPR repeat protein
MSLKIDKKLLKEANNGNPDAEFEVGDLYHTEWLNVKEQEDLDNAAKYLPIEKDILEKADKDILEEEKKDAQFEVGALYHRQWLKVKKNDETKANKYYGMAVEYYKRAVVKVKKNDETKANKYYKKATKYLQIDKELLKAAENGDDDALYNVGALYDRQWSKVKKNDKTKANKYYEMAVEYYERAVEKDNTSAMFFLGNIYKKVKETEKAKSMFRQAAKKGMVDAHYELGLIFLQAAEYKKAMNYFVETLKPEYTNKPQIVVGAKLMIGYIMHENPKENYIEWYTRKRFDATHLEPHEERRKKAVDHISEMKELFTEHKVEVDAFVKELRAAGSSGGKRTIHKRNKTRLGTRKKNKNKNKNKNFSTRNSHGRKKRNKRRTRKTKY